MALIGNFKTYTHKESETETQDLTIEHPLSLPEDHENYHLRGTTTIETVPIVDRLETVMENSYLVIHSYVVYKNNISINTNHLANITYRVYASKEKRNLNNEDYIYEDALLSVEIDPSDSTMTQMAKMYDLIKTIAGTEELIND